MLNYDSEKKFGGYSNMVVFVIDSLRIRKIKERKKAFDGVAYATLPNVAFFDFVEPRRQIAGYPRGLIS